jgi:hemolysin III
VDQYRARISGISVQRSREANGLLLDYDQLWVRPVENNYSRGEILANSITHGIGTALAIVGAVVLIGASWGGGLRLEVSCAVFSFTLIFVYLCSTLYHSLGHTRFRHVLRILDHSSIYLMIAGSYTPFTLVSLHGPWGWTLFGVEWSLAVAGVIFKCFIIDRFENASTLVYLFQGWLVVVVIVPLIHAIGWQGLLWLGAGGLAYTAGIVFYAYDRRPYFHTIWHLFVMAGSTAHYFAVLFYIVPVR